MGTWIDLECRSRQQTDSVTWYWSQCVHDAGVNGIAILPGDNRDLHYSIGIFGAGNFYQRVSFFVTGCTLGYYWCEISSAVNVSLRPSIITPVLQPTNTSLPNCSFRTVINAHNNGPECAVEGSPTIYTRVPLPSYCPSVRQHSASNDPVQCVQEQCVLISFHR